MKPVVIIRFFPIEGPGYFATFLDNNHIPWKVVKVDDNETIPSTLQDFSGLVLMGGPMSVNDDLPWITQVLALIQQAITLNIPVLGHCLGGQLMTKAMGSVVTQGSIKELGWGKVNVIDHPVAKAWLGAMTEFEAFHWHGETFSLPEKAALLFSSPYCAHQAFAVGIHLAMQCHVEVTEEMVHSWSTFNAAEIEQNLSSPAVQTAPAMQERLPQRIAALNGVADQLYKNGYKR
ncbi:MAG: type 1 glutamine amidotransferase [Nitrosomonas sp.]|nr:type 1 glutamine amidotransferase [Nitrosomonas sp.]